MRLFRNVPATTGSAFIVIQHLDPNHPSSLSELIGRATTMSATEAVDGAAVEPNHVYVIPPNTELTFAADALKLSPRPVGVQHAPIDAFMKSLAAGGGSRAVGVILSGAGSDGTAGMLAITAAGGVTFAQEPSTAEFASMPTMASASGTVDFVLTPEEIGVRLGHLSSHPRDRDATRPGPAQPATDDHTLRDICSLMHEATGIDFGLYRGTTVSRRVARRIGVRSVPSLSAYRQLLERDAPERAALQRDLLIGVTSFFRDPESFEALERLVFPGLVRDRESQAPIRLWIAGCATGEEVYSLVMALQEFQARVGTSYRVIAFASDINDEALATARAGWYSRAAVEGVSPERLARWFTVENEGFRIVKELRELCVFSRHNLLDDPPFSKVDLITCRNVLIYLDAAQKSILPRFHYALMPGGHLLLGRSETAHFPELFSVVEPRIKIFAKRVVARRPASTLPLSPPHYAADRPGTPAAQPAVDERTASELARETDRLLLSKYSPASVLVDDALQVLEIRGRTAPFLELSTGKASLHLLNLIPDTGLYLEVERLIREAIAADAPIRREGVVFRVEGRLGTVHIAVSQVHARKQRASLVVFEMATAPPLADGVLAVARPELEREVLKLRREIEAARARLLNLVDEHQSADGEAQQAAEDALSVNEELQSLNEELETAKEELQATNEELLSLNKDLESRNVSLGEARRFASSVVDSVLVPVVILDEQLAVSAANASFRRLFLSSAGQPEGQSILALNAGAWDVPSFRTALERAHAAGVAFEGVEVEREFPPVGRRSLLISGRRLPDSVMLLVTIEDVTRRKAAELALHKSEVRRRETEKMESVGRLAGGIAHEFNNLLTVIIGYSELMVPSVEANAEARLQLKEIQEAASRAATLTDQLLAFGRRKVIQPRVFDLNQLVNEFGTMMRRLLVENVRLVIDCSPLLWHVDADPGEIGRALMNLSLNARDAMPIGGTLTIATLNSEVAEPEATAAGVGPGAYVRLIVRDTGVGMSAELRSHAFEPFYTTKEVHKGAGLGLAAVLGVVQEAGGAVICESEPARGTTFTLLLPASRAAVERAVPIGADLPRTSAAKTEMVLIVEDEPGVRSLTKLVLEKLGYAVLVACDGEEALLLLAAHVGAVDLLITDVVLPTISGREVADRAHQRSPDLKVLFVSGYTHDDILKKGVSQGAAFLQKPFTPATLASAVRALLDGPASPFPA